MVRAFFALIFAVSMWPVAADAQVIGRFRWQVQPYCNVVTLTVTQNGTVFRLEGSDDQCGAAVLAPVVGTAVLNPNGSVGLGLVIVSAPDGVPLHLDAAIDLASVSGAWSDSAGRRGAFVFTPGSAAAGQRRPDVAPGLNGVSLGYGLATGGTTTSPTLQVDVAQIRNALEVQSTPAGLAIGEGAIGRATSGSDNVAVGRDALEKLTSGAGNVALGENALTGVTTGQMNIGIGAATMVSNAAGSRNVAIGNGALYYSTGDRNIAIGVTAGQNITTGNDNIYLANGGFGPDSATIRIGDDRHVSTFIAGISGRTSSSGAQVYVNSSGRLGTVTSSARFKDDIRPIEDVRDKLYALRPVQFVYKAEYDDGSRQQQYGLIAEEVAGTFPELAVFDDEGRPLSVRYHLLTPLLLDELRRLRAEIEALKMASR